MISDKLGLYFPKLIAPKPLEGKIRKKRPIYKNTTKKSKMTKIPLLRKCSFRVKFQNSDSANPHN